MRVPFSSVRKLLSAVYQLDAEKVKGHMTSFSTLLKRLFKTRDLRFTFANSLPARPPPNPHARFKCFQGLEMKDNARALVAKVATPRRVSTTGASLIENTPVSRSLFGEPEDDSPALDFILIHSSEAYILALPLPFSDSTDYTLECADQDIVLHGFYEPDFQASFPVLFSAPVSVSDIECPIVGQFSVHHRLPDDVYNPTEREPIRYNSTSGPLFVFEYRPTSTGKQYQVITCRSFDRTSTAVLAPCVTSNASPMTVSSKTIAAPQKEEEPKFFGFGTSARSTAIEEMKQPDRRSPKEDTSSASNPPQSGANAFLSLLSMLTEDQKTAMRLLLGFPSSLQFTSVPADTITKPSPLPSSSASSQSSLPSIVSSDYRLGFISFRGS